MKQDSIRLSSPSMAMQQITESFSGDALYSEPSFSVLSSKIIRLSGPDDISTSYADYRVSGVIHAAVSDAALTAPPHAFKHSGFELLYVAEGSLVIQMQRKNHRFEAGSAFIVNPNCSYVFLPDFGSLIYGVTISSDFLMNLYRDDHKLHLFPRVMRSFFLSFLLDPQYQGNDHVFFLRREEASPPVEPVLATLHEELCGRAPGFDYMIRALICRLLSRLCSEADYRIEQGSFSPKTAEELAEAVKHYLDTHRRKVLLQELEALTFYSGDYLSRVFKAKMGKSVKDYNLSVCMEEAAYLLKSTNLPIGNIAESLGYRSRSQFYRAFENYYGISASDYRSK